MSALRNYRRSLSERRQSLSEIYQQDVKRISESSTASGSWQANSRAGDRGGSSSDEDEDANDSSRTKEEKPKVQRRKLSFDFLSLRKSKPTENKKKGRSMSTTVPPTNFGHPRAS